MAKKIVAGVTVDVTEEGYLVDATVWTKAIAIDIAQEEGVELSDRHFALLDFLRDKYKKGENLTIRSIGQSEIVDIKGFYQLFPGAPMKKAAKIAGIPKPASCI